MTDNKVEQLSHLIKAWIANTDGWFTYDQLDKELLIKSNQAKNLRRQVINRLKAEAVIVKAADKDGTYRVVRDDAPLIEWLEANLESKLDLKLPFGMHELVNILPKNIIVIAGAPDAGKSAWCFNFIRENMAKHSITYFSSEMGAMELKTRLTQFNSIPLSNWTFEARERSTNFADVIRPDGINIIDYLEITENLYAVGGMINNIHQKLTSGIAAICLQKKRGADLGRGAEFSLEKPRLYLSLDNNIIKIVKAKNWVDPAVNPNGMSWSFRLAAGCKFTYVMPVTE